jgi:hypothetical protein
MTPRDDSLVSACIIASATITMSPTTWAYPVLWLIHPFSRKNDATVKTYAKKKKMRKRMAPPKHPFLSAMPLDDFPTLSANSSNFSNALSSYEKDMMSLTACMVSSTWAPRAKLFFY